MAAAPQQRSGIGALSTHLAISRAIVDRSASNAARVNGAETRASAQIDEVVGSIAGRMYDAAARHSDTGRCMDCGQPAGARGPSGSSYSLVCQACFDQAADQLAASRARTQVVLDRLTDEMRKRPPVKVEGQRLVCTCGDDQFEYLPPERAESDTNVPGHRGGYQCDNCGKFFERSPAERDE